jgi:predicted flap endonuclease-1-like 5' DNA nuclease
MESFVFDNWSYFLAALAVGTLIGWVTRSGLNTAKLGQINNDWQAQLDALVRERDRLTAESDKLRTMVEAQEAVVHQRELLTATAQTQLESALEKEKLMTKNIFMLKAEREGFKSKLIEFQKALNFVKNQSHELQNEFIKSADVYKSELAKSFGKRKLVEEKYENAKQEYESFRNLLHASRSEHDSVNKMLASARARLTNLDALEQNVIELEAENAALKHQSALIRQENQALKRDVMELDELRVQSEEAGQVLKSMENSRKQYEEDANRYRKHADKFEKASDTLRMQLDEVEQNFLEMEQQQQAALKAARHSASNQDDYGKVKVEQEVDNLQEIVGIGKVFEHTLHQLGVVSFRQIASFDITDIATLNTELKEFKGRMEQDDWIGQAKELQFKKYGEKAS